VAARTTWIWLTALVLSACSAMWPHANEPSLERYLRYAGAPIQRFDYRDAYTSWQVVDDYALVMFVGADAYLLRVVPPCPQVRLALSMSVTNATPGIVSRFDRVQLDEHNCLIDEIRQVDYRRMQQATGSSG
jgi:hypothetical protein